jgi:hypothetical protein
VAEIVDQGTPRGGINVLRAGLDDAGVSVDPQHVRLNDEKVVGGVRSNPRRASFHLDWTFGHARWSNKVGRHGPHACGIKLRRLESEATSLVR